MSNLPLSYRWLESQGLTCLIPWHFCAKEDNKYSEKAFENESMCNRKVKIFAKRQDSDDCAGFVIEDGKVSDNVIYFHPSYSNNREKLLINSEHESLYTFIADIVLPDTEEWADEEELSEIDSPK